MREEKEPTSDANRFEGTNVNPRIRVAHNMAMVVTSGLKSVLIARSERVPFPISSEPNFPSIDSEVQIGFYQSPDVLGFFCECNTSCARCGVMDFMLIVRRNNQKNNFLQKLVALTGDVQNLMFVIQSSPGLENATDANSNHDREKLAILPSLQNTTCRMFPSDNRNILVDNARVEQINKPRDSRKVLSQKYLVFSWETKEQRC